MVSSSVKIHHLYISKAHVYYGHHGKPPGEEPMIEVPEVDCVAGRGISGDRFFDYKDDYQGQITFFSREVYARLCEKFSVTDKTPDVFRRNVIVSGVDLNELIGQEFEVQGVGFSGACEASPCYWMDQVLGEGAEEAMKGCGGLRARILSDGVLRVDG